MSSFFSGSDYKKYGENSLEYKMAMSAERAVQFRDDVVSLDSKYVVETGEGLARLEVLDWGNRFDARLLLPVTEFSDCVKMEVPQVFDFLSGIEAMVAKDPLPDWTGCGRQYPIREAYKGNPIRARYTQAVADRARVDVLVNPGRTELYTFPNTPVFYTGDQKWHREEAARCKDCGRKVFDEFPEGSLAYLSMDTWDGKWFPRSIMLVPHPEAFRRNYKTSQIDWDGTSLRYRWYSKMFHDISIRPFDTSYYTTLFTDRMLETDDRAYWLYCKGIDFGAKYMDDRKDCRISTDHRISYQAFVDRARIRDGLALASMCNSGSLGVDLDQSSPEGSDENLVLAVYADEVPIGMPKSQIEYGDIVSKYRLPVYLQNDSSLYLDLPGEIITVPAVKNHGKLIPIVPDGIPVVVFGSFKVLERNFFSFYMKYRPSSHRSVPYLPTSALPIARALNDECSFVEYAKRMEADHGKLSSRILIVLLRQNGAMLHRYDRDRYIMSPYLPGIPNAQEVWNKINANRLTKIIFRHKASKPYIRHWLHILKRNKLQAYYDDFFEQLVVMDPFNDSSMCTIVFVNNEDVFEDVRLDGEGIRDVWVVYKNVEYVTQAPVKFLVHELRARLYKYLRMGGPGRYALVPIYCGKLLSPHDVVPPRVEFVEKEDTSGVRWKQFNDMYG